jgi:hypothetical protein
MMRDMELIRKIVQVGYHRIPARRRGRNGNPLGSNALWHCQCGLVIPAFTAGRTSSLSLARIACVSLSARAFPAASALPLRPRALAAGASA